MNRIQHNFLRRLPPHRRYLVGVSGGRDSVALLHWLIQSGYKNLTVCHLNHRLRGRASGADARFVEKMAERYGANFVCSVTDVRALAKKQKLSVESAGREARYKFFASVAKRTKCRSIFLGHHADDVVETFLINLFRGSGTTGLIGIREVSERRVAGVNLTIVRPLIGVWRREIDRYVLTHRLKFREDSSNRELGPLRNRIRHRVVPYLEKTLGRNIRQNIWRTAMIAAEEEVWIEKQLPESTEADSGAVASAKALGVEKLRRLPVALQRRQILKWLRSQQVVNVGFDVVENVRAMLDRDSRIAKVNLAKGRHARRRAKKIFVTN